jgi:hypothetical protein
MSISTIPQRYSLPRPEEILDQLEEFSLDPSGLLMYKGLIYIPENDA